MADFFCTPIAHLGNGQEIEKMKLNGRTQWYVRSAATEFHLLSLARSEMGVQKKFRF